MSNYYRGANYVIEVEALDHRAQLLRVRVSEAGLPWRETLWLVPVLPARLKGFEDVASAVLAGAAIAAAIEVLS